MGPADQQLSSVDGPDPGLGQQGRRHGYDELAQFPLKLLGFLTGGRVYLHVGGGEDLVARQL
jgi:hypothetical protein